MAVDWPGFGKSNGDPELMHTSPGAFLEDVCRSLGKQHAYAVLAVNAAGASLVSALSERPGASSFACLIDPSPRLVEDCSAMLHPAILLYRKEDKKVMNTVQSLKDRFGSQIKLCEYSGKLQVCKKGQEPRRILAERWLRMARVGAAPASRPIGIDCTGEMFARGCAHGELPPRRKVSLRKVSLGVRIVSHVTVTAHYVRGVRAPRLLCCVRLQGLHARLWELSQDACPDQTGGRLKGVVGRTFGRPGQANWRTPCH